MKKILILLVLSLLFCVSCGRDQTILAAESEEEEETVPLSVGTIKSLTPFYNGITVRWSRVKNAEKYVLYRSEEKESGFRKIQTFEDGDTFSYRDVGLTTGTTYYYRVRAYAGGRYTQTKVKGKKAVPRKAAIQEVTSTGADELEITWKKVSGATGYRIYRSTKEDADTYKKVRTIQRGTTLSYIDTGLTTGKTYYYRVRAYRKDEGKTTWGTASEPVSGTVPKSRWDKLLDRYRSDDDVNQLIFVKYQGGSKARVVLYNKVGTAWEKVLKCRGYVGKNGIAKKKEGDRKTPTGTFTITGAFGKKPKPATSLEYTKVNRYLYWCADREHYNQLIDIREYPHYCSGEHLIDYGKVYDYGLFLDFNAEGEYRKGSGIFMHCFGSNKYTLGCISVSEENMLEILATLEDGAKICIYPES